jgi:hypothetical protein
MGKVCRHPFEQARGKVALNPIVPIPRRHDGSSGRHRRCVAWTERHFAMVRSHRNACDEAVLVFQTNQSADSVAATTTRGASSSVEAGIAAFLPPPASITQSPAFEVE